MSSSYPGYGNSTIQRCQRCGMPLSPTSNGYCGNCGMQNAPSQPDTASGQLPFTSNSAWIGQSQVLQGNGQPAQFGQPGQSGQFGQPGGPPSGLPPSAGFPGSVFPSQQPFGNQSPGNASAPLSPFQVQQPGGPPASQPLSNFPQSYGPQGPFNAPSAPLQPFGNNNQQPFGMQGQFSIPNGFASSSSQTNAPLYQSPSYGNDFQPGNMSGYNPNNLTDPDFSNQRKKPKVGLLIGSVLLVLLLIAGGIGGYMILKSHKSSTTTGLTQPVTPTATPKGPPLFSDSFQNNNKGWYLSSQQGEYSVAIGGGTLALEDDNNRLLWELVPGGKTYNNFLLNVDAVLSKGTQDNGYGIYIRGSSNQAVDIATYYRFELYGDGSFAIFKGTLDATGTSQSSYLVNNTISSAILKQGQLNHISIVASGSSMSLIVNGQLLKTITDNGYTSGSIALFVSNLANVPKGAQAKFSNLAIYPPQ